MKTLNALERDVLERMYAEPVQQPRKIHGASHPLSGRGACLYE